MKKTIRWAILAPGMIAEKFAEGLKAVKDAELVAVASRSASRACEFAHKFNVERHYDSYEALANDPNIDIVYIASPHPFHLEQALLCLENGKSVLCEKPITINQNQLTRMIDSATRKDVFLMEAMVPRFLPSLLELKKWIDSGKIGKIRMIKADFSFSLHGIVPEEEMPMDRHYNLELGGGGLLDVGVYVLNFSSMMMGEMPIEITGMSQIGETGVDEQAGMLMKYENDALAVLTCGGKNPGKRRCNNYWNRRND